MTAQLVELRNYVLVPGGAAPFVEHFERHFLTSQAELGMDVVGQFTVAGDDARFVWIRRYLQPAGRGPALGAFYTGPVWKEHGPRANELMLDHTDVHLLAPDPSAPAFVPDDPARRWSVPADPASTLVAALYDLDDGVSCLPADVAAAMTSLVAAAADVAELGRLVTAAVVNDFPPLPVHDGTVALWLLAGAGAAAAAESLAADHGLALRTLLLTPTSRSALR
jgi:hypothetical protein